MEHGEEAARGLVPGHAEPVPLGRREVPLQLPQQDVQVGRVVGAGRGVGLAQPAVGPEQHAADHGLAERRGVDRRHALQLGQLVGQQRAAAVRGEHPLVGDHVAEPGAGEAGLGGGAEVDHLAAPVQRLQGGARAGLAGEEPVRVVLDHQQPLLGRRLQQPGARPDRHAGAGRVGEVGDDVQCARAAAAGPDGARRLPHGRRVGPALRPLRDGHRRQVEQPGRAGDADVAGRADQQDVLRRGAQRPQHQQHALLRAHRQHQRGRIDVQALVVGEGPGDQVADDALGRPVLEQRGAHGAAAQAASGEVREKGVQVLVDVLRLEESLVRAAGCEGERLRVALGDLVEEGHRVQQRIGQAGVQLVQRQRDGAHRSASRSRSAAYRWASRPSSRTPAIAKKPCGMPS